MLVCAGAVIRLKGSTAGISTTQVVAWIALALSLPVIVAVEYAPWRKRMDFYALPYLFGTAMLLAGGLTAIDRLAPAVAPLAWAACAGVIFFGGLHAARTTGESFARRDVYAAVADYLGAHSRGRPILLRRAWTSSPRLQTVGLGLGPPLSRYAFVLYPDSGRLSIRDTACQVPVDTGAGGRERTVVLTDVVTCGVLGRPNRSFQSTYRAVALSSPIVRTDTIRMDVCDTACEP